LSRFYHVVDLPDILPDSFKSIMVHVLFQEISYL